MGMPSSSVRTATDLDELRALIRPENPELIANQRGQFAATVIRIDLDRLRMQRSRENLARVWRPDIPATRGAVSFPTQPGPAMIYDGVELHSSEIALHGPGQSFRQRSSEAAQWGSISLPVDDLAEIGAAMVGRDLISSHDMVLAVPSAAAMAKLQRLHAEAGRLAETAPEIIANLEAARGLEQALIEAVVDCVASPSLFEDRAARRRHSKIMERFRSVLERNTGSAVYISAICAEIGVSQRTLRACCQEQLGISPKRYLLLRRMHLARRALRQPATPTTTVTEVATRFGFWELGRFAVEYKFLFGESPSDTLRRASR
jgi:AraC-like DNA-binding protein